MANEEKYDMGKISYAWVKDKDGNEYICPIHALKSVDDASEEEKTHCVDNVKSELKKNK